MPKFLLTTCLFVLFTLTIEAQIPYQNKSLTPAARAEDLLTRLTLDEKVALMMNASEAVPRLGIKKYEWWNEALHGVARNGTATVFPQAVGMAASFDDAFLKEVFTSISDEARIKNRLAREAGEFNRYQGLNMWTPNINIFRDPRWGRGQETYGEDPCLTSRMGVAVITGLQGESTNGVDKLHACAKHFAVHSGPEWNRHSYNAENISQRDLWETYLPAFKDAVQKAKVKEVMCAYNRFEGDPCCGSDRLLVHILRDQWQFDGIILSDCGAIDNFYKKGAHMTHPDSASASAAAVLSGTDLECGSSYKAIQKAVEKGLINEAQLDISLKRVLMARFELGEMDGCSPWDSLPSSMVNGAEHQALALKMAHESMVLLQNNGILPLAKGRKIALLGPNANDSVMQWGNYNGFPKHTVTLLAAMQQLVGADMVYDPIGDATGSQASVFDECSLNGQKGFEVMYWNNTDMQGAPAVQTQVTEAVKIGKKELFATGVNDANISAKYRSKFKPSVTGKAEFVFITSNNVKLTIDGQVRPLEDITKTMHTFSFDASAGKEYDIQVELVHVNKGEFRFNILRTKPIDFDKIVQKVKDVDVVVFAGGISARLEREEANVYAPGFKGGDRTDIELPQVQRDVMAALKKAGKKVVFVNFSGSAIGLVPESNNCDAILQAWYPGEAGGKAIVDVLFGAYNPAGRLPVTFYKNSDQLPDFENYNMKGRTYRFMSEQPLFPFGYGLSYTSFAYGKASYKKTIKTGSSLKLIIPVANTGKYNGDEVVQIYLKKKNDANGPVKTLKSFKRITVPMGQTVNVAIELTSDDLAWWNEASQSVQMHAGDYQLMVGGSSRDEDLAIYHLRIK